jgi:hypothetical protein
VLLVGATGFVLASLAMALVRDWGGMLGVGLFAGVVGSPPASVFGGVVADLWAGEMGRGRVLMLWWVFFLLFFFLSVCVLCLFVCLVGGLIGEGEGEGEVGWFL